MVIRAREDFDELLRLPHDHQRFRQLTAKYEQYIADHLKDNELTLNKGSYKSSLQFDHLFEEKRIEIGDSNILGQNIGRSADRESGTYRPNTSRGLGNSVGEKDWKEQGVQSNESGGRNNQNVDLSYGQVDKEYDKIRRNEEVSKGNSENKKNISEEEDMLAGRKTEDTMYRHRSEDESLKKIIPERQNPASNNDSRLGKTSGQNSSRINLKGPDIKSNQDQNDIKNKSEEEDMLAGNKTDETMYRHRSEDDSLKKVIPERLNQAYKNDSQFSKTTDQSNKKNLMDVDESPTQERSNMNTEYTSIKHGQSDKTTAGGSGHGPLIDTSDIRQDSLGKGRSSDSNINQSRGRGQDDHNTFRQYDQNDSNLNRSQQTQKGSPYIGRKTGPTAKNMVGGSAWQDGYKESQVRDLGTSDRQKDFSSPTQSSNQNIPNERKQQFDDQTSSTNNRSGNIGDNKDRNLGQKTQNSNQSHNNESMGNIDDLNQNRSSQVGTNKSNSEKDSIAGQKKSNDSSSLNQNGNTQSQHISGWTSQAQPKTGTTQGMNNYQTDLGDTGGIGQSVNNRNDTSSQTDMRQTRDYGQNLDNKQNMPRFGQSQVNDDNVKPTSNTDPQSNLNQQKNNKNKVDYSEGTDELRDRRYDSSFKDKHQNDLISNDKFRDERCDHKSHGPNDRCDTSNTQSNPNEDQSIIDKLKDTLGSITDKIKNTFTSPDTQNNVNNINNQQSEGFTDKVSHMSENVKGKVKDVVGISSNDSQTNQHSGISETIKNTAKGTLYNKGVDILQEKTGDVVNKVKDTVAHSKSDSNSRTVSSNNRSSSNFTNNNSKQMAGPPSNIVNTQKSDFTDESDKRDIRKENTTSTTRETYNSTSGNRSMHVPESNDYSNNQSSNQGYKNQRDESSTDVSKQKEQSKRTGIDAEQPNKVFTGRSFESDKKMGEGFARQVSKKVSNVMNGDIRL